MKCIRYSYGSLPYEFVTFVKEQNGEVRCFSPMGEIKRDKSMWNPILGPFRDERIAWEKWNTAVAALNSETMTTTTENEGGGE